MALRELFRVNHVASEVEIGVSSLCNARCVHCPPTRRARGQNMKQATFDRLLELYVEHYPPQSATRPKFLFAGSGEPLLNKRLEAFVGAASEAGFRTGVITNAALLTPERFVALAEAGLNELYISIQGNAETYHDLMGLDYDRALGAVDIARQILDSQPSYALRLCVVSSDIAGAGVTIDEVKKFWAARGVEHQGPFPVWNRGGNLADFDTIARPESAQAGVNFELPAWCLVLKYKDSIDSDGSFVKCECDYFGPAETYGNVHTHSLADVYAAYEDLLRGPDVPASCRRCIKSGTEFFIQQHIDMVNKEVRRS
jgi:Radical SAM superfamily